MSRVRSQDTGPERAVRSILHRLGYRFRLHMKSLPGTPDIVLPRRGVVVFVHGCFWHGHRCKVGKMPKSRTDYWGPKIEANQARDVRKSAKLRRLGWSVITVYECELKRPDTLAQRLRRHIVAPLVQADL